jgi:effector-binding domain-containing protein
MNKKKYLLVFLLLFVPTLIWYLFFKQSDYVINFRVKTATGVVFQGVKDWAKEMKKSQNQDFIITQKNNFDAIALKTSKKGQTIYYYWTFKPLNDSITAVSVGIQEEGKSSYNRFTVPFFKTQFKENQIKIITEFREKLNQHLSTLKVKIEGEGTTEATFVAYIRLKNVLQQKAQNMIMENALFMAYLSKNNIKIAGKPFCDVIDWKMDSEELIFDYCFPIDKNAKYVADKNYKFKLIPAKRGLKATYYGNMRTSDRAWFALMDYAKTRNVQLSNKPLEHFFANPFNGGDELTWETKIIIPYK